MAIDIMGGLSKISHEEEQTDRRCYVEGVPVEMAWRKTYWEQTVTLDAMGMENMLTKGLPISSLPHYSNSDLEFDSVKIEVVGCSWKASENDVQVCIST